MDIMILRSSEVDPTLPSNILKVLKKARGPLRFRSHALHLDIGDAPVAWGTMFELMEEFRQSKNIPAETLLILLTDKPNSYNWFSSPDPRGRPMAFIHSADWDYYLPCDRVYPLAYEVMAMPFYYRLTREKGQEALENHTHGHPIGCISDMCGWKPDISLKMRTADICPECRSLMRELELPKEWEEQAIDLFEKVRKHILYTPRRDEREEITDDMPYPVAITKRKIASTKDPLRMLLFLIDHFDALIRMTVILGAHKAHPDQGDLEAFFLNRELTVKPTLGTWVAALRELAEFRDGQGLPLFRSLHGNGFDEVIAMAQNESIVHMRNTARGHGYISLHDEGYRNLLEQYIPVISEIETVLRPFLTSYSYWLVDHIERHKVGLETLTIRNLVGASEIFQTEREEVATDGRSILPLSKRIYAVPKESGPWIDLYPHMVMEVCPQCRRPQVLLADGQCFLDVHAGHQVTLPKLG